MIRFGKSTQQTSKNPKKPDNLEILTLLDNCTLIFKDDRIALRNLVKDGNSDVIAILNHYKKSTNFKDLSTDLRKYLRKKGDKENEKVFTCQSPTSNRYKQAPPPPLGGSQKKSCPDLWSKPEPQSPKTINLGKAKEIVNDVQLSEIVLSDRNFNESKEVEKTNIDLNHSRQYLSQQQTHFVSERDSKTLQQHSQLQNSQQQEQDIDLREEDDVQSESSNESILQQITQPPQQVHQAITPKNELRPTQLFQSGHSSYLQINVAQSYLQPQLVQQSSQISQQVTQQHSNKEILIQDCQKHYSFFNYQDYQQIAQPQYKHMFTHWPSLLHKLDKPEFVPNQRAPTYINTYPENLFSFIFPTSSHVKINYYTFINLLKGRTTVDLDELFKQLDTDSDDWINYRETGLLLEGICLQVEQPKNCVKVIFETLKNSTTSPNIITLQDLEFFEQKSDFCFARQLMQEADIEQKGFLTYWDLYMHREIYLMERLCQIISGGQHSH